MMTGISGLGAMAPMGLSGLNGGLNGPLSQLAGAGPAGASTVSMQQLSELVAGFTSAEILMALMIAAASQKNGKDDDQSGALALLAGMALANSMQGVAGIGGCPSSTGFNAGDIGGVLNVVA
jgi:hypothetical protein